MKEEQVLQNQQHRPENIKSTQKPELIIAEDINELRNEILRKDQILTKYYEKLQLWQTMLNQTVAQMPPNATTNQ